MLTTTDARAVLYSSALGLSLAITLNLNGNMSLGTLSKVLMLLITPVSPSKLKYSSAAFVHEFFLYSSLPKSPLSLSLACNQMKYTVRSSEILLFLNIVNTRNERGTYGLHYNVIRYTMIYNVSSCNGAYMNFVRFLYAIIYVSTYALFCARYLHHCSSFR